MKKFIIILAIFLIVEVTNLIAKQGNGGKPPRPHGPGCPKCKEVEGEGELVGTYYFHKKDPQCENGCSYIREDKDCCYCFQPGNYSVTKCHYNGLDWSPIVPKFLPQPPPQKLHLSWSGLAVKPNQLVNTTDMLEPPSLAWNWAKNGSLYTVLIVDLGLVEKLGGKQYIHWFVTNIPGTDVADGDEVMEYIPPFSVHLTEAGTIDEEYLPAHPYLAMAFRQEDRIDVEETYAGCDTNIIIARINDKDALAVKYNLSLVAANFLNAPYSGEATNSLICMFTKCTGKPFPPGSALLAGINDGPECQAN